MGKISPSLISKTSYIDAFHPLQGKLIFLSIAIVREYKSMQTVLTLSLCLLLRDITAFRTLNFP